MKIIRCIVGMLIILSISMPSTASDVISRVTSQELKELVSQSGTGPVIIDTRSPAEYLEARIPTAVSIPIDVLLRDPSLPKLPKDTRIVFYCSGSA